MVKKRISLVLVAIFLLNFYFGNISFAIENIELRNKFSDCRYPNYSYEFTGKDPCEKFNRKLFVFNLKLNKYVLRPVNTVWASVMPKYGMDRLQNAYNNVNFPVRLVSTMVQKGFSIHKAGNYKVFNKYNFRIRRSL